MNIQLLTPNFVQNFKTREKSSNNVIRQSIPLQGLTKDTVSFSGGAKLLEQRTKEVSFQLAKKVYQEAQDPLRDLLVTFRKNFKKDFVTLSHPDNPIVEIKGRVKKPLSIAEKAISRKLYSAKEINKMGDVIGLRINLADSDIKTCDKLFTGLGEMVKKGDIKVLEVENYRMTPKQSFISKKTLDKFETICNKKGQLISRREQAIPNGYTAVHVALELPSGQRAELQIMTRSMEQTKEIEDFYYKLRCNKEFPEEYKSIEDMMKDKVKDLDEFQQETLKHYIKDSYEYAYKAPREDAKRKAPQFIPFPYSLPQEISYTNLRKLKLACDAAKKNDSLPKKKIAKPQ